MGHKKLSSRSVNEMAAHELIVLLDEALFHHSATFESQHLLGDDG
jgi:hypothetical protein